MSYREKNPGFQQRDVFTGGLFALFGIQGVLGLKRGRACDPITRLSGVHFLTTIATNLLATLKARGFKHLC
jgi:hypothetical protein